MCVRLTPTLKPVYESSLSRHWTLWTLKNIYSYSIHLDSLECPKQCPVRAQCPIRCPKPLNVPQVRTFIIGVLHNGFWRSCRGAEVARFYGHSRLHVTRVHKRKGPTPKGRPTRISIYDEAMRKPHPVRTYLYSPGFVASYMHVIST